MSGNTDSPNENERLMTKLFSILCSAFLLACGSWSLAAHAAETVTCDAAGDRWHFVAWPLRRP